MARIFERYVSNGVMFVDENNSRKKSLSVMSGVKLLYPSVDGGTPDTLIDPTIRRVNNAQLDGWRVTGLPFHYAIGTPQAGVFSGVDGVSAFWGKRGAEKLSFRLSRIGWTHWPTNNFTGLGGAPNYRRRNLSRTKQSVSLQGQSVDVGQLVEWSDLWTTPGGGSVGIKWRVDANRVKEEVVIDQLARVWLAANPPATAEDRTFLTALFEIDIPTGRKIRRKGQQTKNDIDSGSFDLDDNENDGLEFLNNLDEFFAFMPISEGWVNDANGDLIEDSEVKLRKRFFRRNGKLWVAVGIRADRLAALPAGDLILDPTIDQDIDSGDNDAHQHNNGVMNLTSTQLKLKDNNSGDQKYMGMRFIDVPFPEGATVDTSYVTVHCVNSVDGIDNTINVEDVDSAAAFATSSNNISNRTLTSSGVAWTGTANGGAINSPSLNAPLQDVFDRAGWAEDNDVVVIINVTNGVTDDWRVRTYNTGTQYAPTLYIEYTEAAAGGQPIMKRHISIPHTGTFSVGRFF